MSGVGLGGLLAALSAAAALLTLGGGDHRHTEEAVASKVSTLLSSSAVDPDSMGSLDLYLGPDLQSGSRSRRAKITHKHRKRLINLIF